MAALDSFTLADKDKRKQEDFRESCSLCLEAYVGRTPKLLPCFHTFCLPCLTALAESVTSGVSGIHTTAQSQSQSAEAEVEEKVDSVEDVDNERETRSGNEEKESAGGTDDEQVGNQGGEREGVEDKEDKEEGGQVICGGGDSTSKAVFLCPTCRAPVTVPEGGVSALQTNFYIVTDADEASQPVACEMCEEEDRKEAEFTCDKCRQRMCRTCRRLHDKFLGTKDHHVRPLSTQERASSRNNTEVNKCRVHQDQELCLFCKDCDVCICVVCKLTSHQPHETEDMAVAALRGKVEVGVLVNTAKKQIQVMKKLLTRLSRDVQELSHQQQEGSSQVRTRYEEVLRWALRSRDELLETISAEAENALAGLRAEETSAQNTLDSLCRLVSRAAPASKDNAEVLLLKNELQAAVLEDDQFEGHKRESEREEHRPFLLVKGDSSAVDLDTVRAYLGVLAVGNSGDVPFVSLREQIQALDSKLGKMKTSQEVELQRVEKRLDTEVGEVKARIDTSVAFHVTGSCTVQKDETVKLTQTETNIGNAYNKDTGVFTAPVSGLYSFQATLSPCTLQKGRTCHIRLCTDDIDVAEAICQEEPVTASPSTISAVIHVLENGRVFLKNASGSQVTFCPFVHDLTLTTFSGYLVTPD